MKRIAIFASGNGTNAENIIKYFIGHPSIIVDVVLTNNANAIVIDRAAKYDVPSIIFTREELYQSSKIPDELISRSIDLIVLAGFMWLAPSNLIHAFPNKMINIHPALLPKYGGKGMYGNFVHQAVSGSGEIVTGITIHYVNEKYDDGAIIFQKEVTIKAGENPESIAKKIHTLEYEFFPRVIDEIL